MQFRVTGSPVETMNGDYSVSVMGEVRRMPDGAWMKPTIDSIVKGMCKGGGLIWIGKAYLDLVPGNEEAIMQALGFEGWPPSVEEGE